MDIMHCVSMEHERVEIVKCRIPTTHIATAYYNSTRANPNSKPFLIYKCRFGIDISVGKEMRSYVLISMISWTVQHCTIAP